MFQGTSGTGTTYNKVSVTSFVGTAQVHKISQLQPDFISQTFLFSSTVVVTESSSDAHRTNIVCGTKCGWSELASFKQKTITKRNATVLASLVKYSIDKLTDDDDDSDDGDGCDDIDDDADDDDDDDDDEW